MRFTITTSGWGGEQRLNTTPMTPGRWTHVAVTLSGNTGKLFVDGIPVASSNSMTVNPSDIGTEFNYLGESQFVADPLFDGALDDVRFHNYALSDVEIQKLAAAASPQFSTATLDSFPVGLHAQDSLTSMVSGGTGVLRFEKIGGPSWLSLSAEGALLGVPGLSDAGEEILLVRVTDTNGISDIAELLVKVTAPDPTARYPFDNSPQNVLGGEPASLVGGPVYSSGHRGQALQFDGSNDHVVLPEGVASSEKLTFAAWVNWDGGDSWQRIFDFGNGTDSYLFLSPKSPSNRLRFAIKDGGSEQAMETTVLPIGVWSHVAVTLGDGVGRLYVNGALRATNSGMTLSPANVKPRINYLGRSQWPDPYFDGAIDEVAIYPRVLTLSEINALRLSSAPSFDQTAYLFSELAPGDVFETALADNLNGGTPPFVFSKVSGPAWLTVEDKGRLSGVPQAGETGTNHFTVQVIDANNLATSARVTIPVAAVPGLMAHYEFEGNSLDRVSNLHGTRFGSPVFGDGPLGRSLIFDGSNDYVRFPVNYVSTLSDATFVVRYRWHGGGNWQRVLDFGNNTSEYLMLTPSNGSGQTEFRITTGGSATAQSLIAPASPVDEWVHAVITLSGNTGALYLNGALVDTVTMTLNPQDIAPAFNYLGKSQWPDPLFDGEIDDFQIHNRALSANEVRLLAHGSEAAMVEPGYDFWAEGFPFENSTDSGWNEDPDKDGSLNVFEWLFDTHPLNGDASPDYTGQVVSAASLGLAGDDFYLALTARVRKSRPGFSLIAQGATGLDRFDQPGSEELATALDPVEDGEFELRTWLFATPVDGNSRAFLRLKVTPK